MAELPDDGDRGELWRVRVPVVFEIAARSWAQARAIVDQALNSRSIGALTAPETKDVPTDTLGIRVVPASKIKSRA